MPFFHIYGQTVVLNMGLAKGSTIVTMQRFDCDALMDLIEEHGVTWLHVAPPVILASWPPIRTSRAATSPSSS